MRTIFTILLTCLLSIAASSGGIANPATAEANGSANPRFFGGYPGALSAVKARLAAGDAALRPALAALADKADRALEVKPPSVTHKAKPGTSGDLHDYFSQAPYFWPDPNSSNGLPYLARDGRVNPESRKGTTDQKNIELLGGTVEPLALAYYFTGKEAYAEQAARCLRVWFLDPATKMNPNMNQAQAVPGKNTGRGIGRTLTSAGKSTMLHAGGNVTARILIDRGLVESFWNAGEAAFCHGSLHTDPGPAFAIEGAAVVEELTIYPLANIWAAK